MHVLSSRQQAPPRQPRHGIIASLHVSKWKAHGRTHGSTHTHACAGHVLCRGGVYLHWTCVLVSRGVYLHWTCVLVSRGVYLHWARLVSRGSTSSTPALGMRTCTRPCPFSNATSCPAVALQSPIVRCQSCVRPRLRPRLRPRPRSCSLSASGCSSLVPASFLSSLSHARRSVISSIHRSGAARHAPGTLAHGHTGTPRHTGTLARWHAGTLARWHAPGTR
jgi:hypothetical protein